MGNPPSKDSWADDADPGLFRTLVEHSYDPIIVGDWTNNLLYVSPSVQHLFGWTAEELVGGNGFDYVHPDDLETAFAHGIKSARSDGARVRTEIRLRHRDGSYRWVELSTVNLTDHPAVQGYVHNYVDVTERHEAEARLRTNESRLQALVESADGAILMFDRASGVAWSSPGAGRLWGVEDHQLSTMSLLRRCHPDARRALAQQLAKLAAAPRGAKVSTEIRMRHRDGSWRWFEGVFTNGLDDPAVGGVVVNVRDTTGRVLIEQALRESEAKLEYQALHDPLTGLPNRTLLFDRMREQMERARTTGADPVVLFCDLDNFKFINDSQGHAMGDELLKAVARRLQRCIGTEAMASRFGGDEFIVLTDDIGDAAEAQRLAAHILEALAVRIPTSRGDMYVTASIGIARGRPGQDSPGDLIRDADAALYVAKERGRNRVETFDASMRERAMLWHETERALRGAIDRHEFELRFMPIVDIRSGAIDGMEALVRWRHPERGLLAPGQFIDVAEQTGLVIPLGAWVLQQACATVARWQRSVGGRAGLGVSVNLSARQLADGSLCDDLSDVLAATGMPPRALTLEVTESEVMRDLQRSTEVLQRLQALDVRVAIDDFGTGHSSFAYLGRLPVDTLKIDRSFVGVITPPDEEPQGTVPVSGGVDQHLALVETIIHLGHILHLDVVAEGVESAYQVEMLAARGCDQAQGFRYSEPLTDADALGLLQRPPADWAVVAG